MSALVIPPGFADPDAVTGPVSIRQPVAWGELDALGHVNHTVFLRWFENVRLAWFERVGIGASRPWPRTPSLREPGNCIGPIVARVECDYRAPVEFPDAIWASARCIELGRSSLTLHNRIWSERRAANVAEGRVVVVMIDYGEGRSVLVPEPVRAAILALDQPRERGVDR